MFKPIGGHKTFPVKVVSVMCTFQVINCVYSRRRIPQAVYLMMSAAGHNGVAVCVGCVVSRGPGDLYNLEENFCRKLPTAPSSTLPVIGAWRIWSQHRRAVPRCILCMSSSMWRERHKLSCSWFNAYSTFSHIVHLTRSPKCTSCNIVVELLAE